MTTTPVLCTHGTSRKMGDRKMAPGRKLLAAVFVAALSVSGAAVAEDNINLTYHSAFGQAALNEASRVWMDEVEARTDGRVTFTRLFGGTLGKFAGQPDGLKARSFDVGQLSAVYNPGLYPRATTTIMTFLTDNAEAHNLASHEFFSSPDLQAEFDALNQKFMFVGQWVRIEMLSYDHVNTMEELKQIKIRAHGGAADALEAAGITAYAIPWGELPAAAERRVVDAGIMGAPAAAADFGFGDIFEYWYGYMPIYYFPMTLVMNKEAWEELPADIQQIIEDVNEDMVPRSQAITVMRDGEAEAKLTEELGVKKVRFAEREKLEAAAAGANENWKVEMAEKGIDGEALLNTYFELLKKHGG